jgi:hypothetical protein
MAGGRWMISRANIETLKLSLSDEGIEEIDNA